jgi:hypothetical protein
VVRARVRLKERAKPRVVEFKKLEGTTPPQLAAITAVLCVCEGRLSREMGFQSAGEAVLVAECPTHV